MNYKKNYFDLINNAKNRILTEKYEIHHILPRSLGGNDELDNLVKLTYREHYLAHYLLYKFTNRIEMTKAFVLMSSRNKIFSSRAYEKAKIELGKISSKKIICLQNMMIFESINKAANWISNKNAKSIAKEISALLNGKRKRVHGYTFQYYDENKKYELEEFKQKKKIICLQTLKIYNNAKEAEKDLDIDYKSISRSYLNGISTKGYSFEFYDENKKYKKISILRIHKQKNLKIKCLETNKVYNSLNELAKELNIYRSTIARYVKSDRPYKNLHYVFIKS